MADTSFFSRLNKLFRTTAIVTVDKDGKRKVVDTDERQQTNLSQLRDRYTKLQRSYTEFSQGHQSMAYQQVRREIFRDYDAMDNDPIIASALDIYADESTLKNEAGDILLIESDSDQVYALLHNLFYDVLNLEFNLWPWVRSMCKYGDYFLTLEIGEGTGIINVNPQSVYYTERIEGIDPEKPNVVKFKVEQDPNMKMEYDNYEMAHFRLLSDTNWLPYGKSMIENARRLWKQLSLMEDAMLIHRIMRAPEKRVFSIDIGNINPAEVDNYMQQIINKMKKVPFLDKRTGDYNLKYNMQNLTEDFFLPVRGRDSGTRIDSLGGLDYSPIEDIDYLKNKMFAALKIPRAYLGYEEDLSGKAALAAEDVRFARTIERIQRTVVSELTKIAIIHLYAHLGDNEEMTNFSLSLVNSSTIYEQEKMNLWSEKVRLASDMKDLKMLSKDWIYENILKMTDKERDIQKAKVVNDQKDAFRHEQISLEGNDPAEQPEKTDIEEDLNNLKQELSSNGKVGRPKEGNTYGKDKSPFGRDPLGDKERKGALKHTTTERKAEKYVNGISARRKYLHEGIKSMLDESNILDDNKADKEENS
jgi:hypothetical protein